MKLEIEIREDTVSSAIEQVYGRVGGVNFLKVHGNDAGGNLRGEFGVSEQFLAVEDGSVELRLHLVLLRSPACGTKHSFTAAIQADPL